MRAHPFAVAAARRPAAPDATALAASQFATSAATSSTWWLPTATATDATAAFATSGSAVSATDCYDPTSCSSLL